MFQYGGDEFTPDPARFAAQKPGSSVYNADSYYLGKLYKSTIFIFQCNNWYIDIFDL